MYSVSTGSDNTAVGREALQYCSTGYHNTAVGQEAMKLTTSGYDNVAVGHNALKDNTTGFVNVAIGPNCGQNITTGDNNSLLGNNAASTLTRGDNNVYLGAAAQASSANVVREYVIGYNVTGKGGQTFFAGGTNGAYNEDNSSSWRTTSDRRIKKNIVDNNEGLSLINQIAVKNFEYKTAEEIEADGEVPSTDAVAKTGTQIGVIAQELQEVRPGWVTTRESGTMAVNSDEITWHLVNAVKELSAENEAFKARLDAAGI
ncbi:MAG: hypothetical protein DWQ21_10365 [Bacteroidetes bacterium]|nr:MAG: hypothetical protein DWQ21_10365 [Bacteroidota bacterium]